MPITTINPTAHTTPDQGGTSAFDNAANSSGSSGVSASFSGISGSDANAESIRWHTFVYSGPSPVAIKLKYDWDADGSTSMNFPVAGSGNTSARFRVEHTVNGGSNWSTQVDQESFLLDEGNDSFDTNGSETINLSVGQDISQVQVRSRVDASVSVSSSEDGNTASASVNGAVSDIRLEITTPDGAAVIIAM